MRRTLAVTSVILAAALISTLTMDLGPALRKRAETAGTNYLKREMTIGELHVRIWDGAYVVRNMRIAGLTPTSRPWLIAREIVVKMPNRRSLLNNQIILDSIEMTGWTMYVEQTPDGKHSFPDFKRASNGPKKWTTTLKYVRASQGEFTFDDQGTPWGVIARNIDVIVAKPAEEYRGSARFSNGLVTIQDYLPFRADMDTTFKINGGRVLFDQINLATDGTRSVLKGDVDMSHWPEQMYSVKSKIDLPRMREIWFAKDKFDLGGTAEFDGYFHLYKGEVRPDRTTAGGREVKGTFRTSGMRVNDYQFDDVAGSVLWNPRQLRVHNATARLYGGAAGFEYSMAPLGVRDVKPTNRFDANYRNVDLTALSDFFELMGIRLAGRGSGHNLMEWPSGRFRDRTWTGTVTAEPPAGTALMTRNMPLEELKQRAPRNQKPGEFSPYLPKGPVPIGGTLSYSLGPEWIEIGPSRIATPTTYVEIEGRTAYGERSQMPFHVTSSDWQDSDRLFAGMLTAFGSATKVIPVDGYGTFDGTMLNEFRRPRIEGTFAGEGIRAFDVTWGSVKGDAIIENAYATVTNVMVASGDSTMTVDGKFSLGYPRRDGGQQIDATVRIDGRPVADLKHAFDIDDYDFSGRMSGNFKVTGEYERPFGSGTMTITEGKAYGETFETATADVKLEGDNVRLDNIQVKKDGGQGSGSASIAWKGTYSFNFTGSNIAAETLALTQGSTVPFSGVIDFTADGAGTFDKPQYTVKGAIRDLFIADEGIGTVFTQFDVDGDVLRFNRINVDTARLSVFASGKIAMNDAHDTDLTFNVLNSSLDPYIRAFEPRLSPYTTAIVSGSVHVYGELSNIDNVLIDATVSQFDARLFDFQIRNKTDVKAPEQRVPIRLRFERHSVRVLDMQLEGQDTDLNVAGNVDLHNETIAMRLGGGANLRILEGFTRNVSSRGTAKVDAELSGNMRSPMLSGKMEVNDGRIRHYSLPHALTDLSGVMTFDSKGINLDELTAKIGGGPVTFGGSIGIDGYRPGRVDVTMVGENMTLRYPDSTSAWLVATVDADLTLDGSVDALNLGGDVDVHRAQYTKRFDAGVNFFDFGQGSQTAAGSTFLTPTLPLKYNVHISAPSTITANNNLLQNVAASADVTLVGDFDRPGLTGNIDVDRGDVYFAGRRYQIRTGSSIRFDNLMAIEPFFDIEAVTRIRVPGETYVVTVTNAGPNFSNVTFSSDPSLPELQLLALLLSDVAPSKDVELRQYQGITPQEQMLRTELTRILTSTATGEFNRAVQDALAVESFQFSPTLVDPTQSARFDPGARVTFVKRVGNRIYLTYSRSLSSTTRDQVIVLEIDQTDRVSWILSRNEDGTYALDLRARTTF